MPPLYELDEYRGCLQEPGSVYCILDLELSSQRESPLLLMIQEYSADTKKHFNHTEIHRGICVTKKCRRFLKNNTLNTTEGIKYVLDECLNKTIWKEYELEARVSNIRYCNRYGEKKEIDGLDLFVAIVYIVILSLNFIGSFYDVWLRNKGKSDQGNRILLAFSLRRNWSKLRASSGEGPEPRLSRFKAIHGMRSITLICVLFSHTTLILSYSYVDNPLYIEKAYDDPMMQILLNGCLVIQTFFIMSSFLLAYNFELYNEKHRISLWQFPKGLIQRWWRLTPTYALILATISTWMRHLGKGPLWRHVVVSEAEACRQYWWYHLLYINNYIYSDVYCAPQTWYLASDTQLFAAGLLFLLAVRGARARWLLLGAALALGLLLPALHTALQDLDATVIQSPESYRNLYAVNDTFRLVYTRGHTNLVAYVLGMAGGLLYYRAQAAGVDVKQYKGYRWAYWLMFPAGVGVILSGGLFYTDGERASLAARVLYASFNKMLFSALVLIIMLGAFWKYENLYRSIMEWRGWVVSGRLSYCGFLLHTLLQRGFVGSALRPFYMNDYAIVVYLSGNLLLTFVFAAILFLLVEAPLSQVQKLVFSPAPRALQKNISFVHENGSANAHSKL